jgi:hypothetical protein
MKAKKAEAKFMSRENAAINKSLKEAAAYALKLAKQTKTRFVTRQVKSRKAAAKGR